MVKAVFFDVANTLLEKPDLLPRIVQVLNGYDHTVTVNQLRVRHKLLTELIPFPDKTSREFYITFNRELLCALGIMPNVQLIQDIFHACTYLPWKAFDDISVISDIRLPMGIASNWDDGLREQLKANAPFSFEWIFGSAELGVRKPSIDFFFRITSETGLMMEEILFVGDSIKLDIEPALTCGMQAVLVDRYDIYPNASVDRIKTMSELKRFL